MHHLSASEEEDRREEQAFLQNGEFGPRLRRKQEQFLHALIAGGSIKYAAREINISYRTALRWMANPHCRALYEEIVDGMLQHNRDQLQHASELAIDTLVHVLLQHQNTLGSGDSQATHAAIKAAKTILDQNALSLQVQLLRDEVALLRKMLAVRSNIVEEQPGLSLVKRDFEPDVS